MINITNDLVIYCSLKTSFIIEKILKTNINFENIYGALSPIHTATINYKNREIIFLRNTLSSINELNMTLYDKKFKDIALTVDYDYKFDEDCDSVIRQSTPLENLL